MIYLGGEEKLSEESFSSPPQTPTPHLFKDFYVY